MKDNGKTFLNNGSELLRKRRAVSALFDTFAYCALGACVRNKPGAVVLAQRHKTREALKELKSEDIRNVRVMGK